MGFTEEGIFMSDESKKKAALPDEKVKGLFYFGTYPNQYNLRF